MKTTALSSGQAPARLIHSEMSQEGNMATPFIDSLSADRRIVVAKKAKEVRPAYYDTFLAERQALAAAGTKGAGASASEGQLGKIMISADLEAALILASTDTKSRLVKFIQKSIEVVTNVSEEDFALMEEVLALRKDSYEIVFRDTGAEVSEYDSVRASFLASVDSDARSQNNGNTHSSTSVVLNDIGPLFASLSDSRTSLARTDDLALHDRIADAGIVYTYQNAALNRSKELSSWVAVIQTYLI